VKFRIVTLPTSDRKIVARFCLSRFEALTNHQTLHDDPGDPQLVHFKTQYKKNEFVTPEK